MLAIKLHIVNFRCFSNYTIILKPFTLLDGKSGVGKTTIMKALIFVLSGESKHCIKFGERNCAVTASFNINETEYIVHRTIRPNNLKVSIISQINIQKYEDAEAQFVLNNIVAANSLKLSYVAQSSSAFLNMTPGDMFKLIRSIIIDEQRLNQIKQNLKLMRINRQRQYDKITGKLSAFRLIEEDVTGSNESVTDLQKEIRNLRENIITCEKDNELRQYIIAKLETLPSRSLKDVVHEQTELAEAMPFLEAWHKLGCMDIQLIESAPITVMVAQKHEITLKLKAAQLEASTTGTQHKCPCCNASLIVRGGKLHIMKDMVCRPEDHNLQLRINQLEAKLEDLNLQLSGVDISKYTHTTPNAFELYKKIPLNGISKTLINTPLSKLLETAAELERESIGCAERNHLESLDIPQYKDINTDRIMLEQLEQRLRLALAGQNQRTKLLRQGTKIEASLAAESLARSIALTSLVAEAETSHMELCIKGIDQVLDELITAMSYGKLHTKLKLESKLGVQKLKVIIINNGEETDHTTLSGGEASRLNIAMAVVMSIVKNIPFLLLDEATSSLDEETASNVITVIKEAYNGTIICIAHQAVKGGFDYVVTVDGN